MAIYAIGDLQGCHSALRRLLEKLDFSPAEDQVWFCGDLVNRGPDSLATLRYIKSLGDSAVTVLGNHDLHLLAAAAGVKKEKESSLAAILNAPDRDELLHWLRCKPLLYHDKKTNFSLAHAGIYPWWSLDEARERASELEQVLCDDDYEEFLFSMYGNRPDVWKDDLRSWERLRFICNAFTRMRYCFPDGKIDLKSKGPIGTQTWHTLPWFEIPERKTKQDNIAFGHWSTLGLHQHPNIFPLDTGCVWGGRLTALKIDRENPQYIQIDCEQEARSAGK